MLCAAGLALAGVLGASPSPPTQDASEWVSQLASPRPEEREQAARNLKALGAAAVPALREAEVNPDPEVAARAGRLLQSIRVSSRLTPALIKTMPGIEDRLNSPAAWTAAFLDASRRFEASPAESGLAPADLAALAQEAVRGARPDDELHRVLAVVRTHDLVPAAPELIRLMARTPDPAVRAAALGALEALLPDAPPRPPVPWVPALSGDDLETAAKALSRLDAARHEEAIAALLKDEAPAIRRIALASLAGKDVRAFTDVLTERLLDPSPEARAAAASLLGGVPQPALAGPLVRCLVDDAPIVRSAALDALARLGGSEAPRAVAPLLADRVPEVRIAAVGALEKLKARDRAPDLVALLGDPVQKVRHAAFSALDRLDAGAEAGPRLLELLNAPDPAARILAATLAGRLRIPSASESLLPLLGDLHPGVRSAAAEGLGIVGRREVADRIAPLLADPEPVARWGAVTGLAELGDDAPREWIRLLGDPDESVRFAALHAVGRLARRECAPRLEELLADPSPVVRSLAAGALGRLAYRDSTPVLRGLLADPDPQVRIDAAAALCRMGATEGAAVLVETGHRLGLLNALRSPDDLTPLRTRPIGTDFAGTRRELLRQVSRSAGKTSEIDPALSDPVRQWLDGPLRLPSRNGHATLADPILEWDGPAQIVLERDAWRVIPATDALRFWKSWLAGRPLR
jgi:HEAT repeat protein